MNNFRQRLRCISLEVRFQISCRCHLWLLMTPFTWKRKRRFRARPESVAEEARVSAHLDLVIDGFPGSANSFATRAFRAMQEKKILVGNHYHSPAETVRAARMGIPVLMTLRRPADSVSSMVRRWPFVPYESALRWYLMFYEAIEPYLDQMIVSDFAVTTKKLPEVVAGLNAKFGTAFEAQLSPDRMAEFEPRLQQTPAEREERELQKGKIEASYLRETTARRRGAAEAVYERLASLSFRC